MNKHGIRKLGFPVDLATHEMNGIARIRDRRSRSLLLTIPVALAGLCTSVFAQTPTERADGVVLHVAVSDAYGRYVQGLQKDDFTIREGKITQDITSFSDESGPMSIGFMVDTSGSMQGAASASFNSIPLFVGKCCPGSEFFIMKFDTKPELLVDWTQGGTRFLEELVGTTVLAEGYTAFYDAIEVGLDKAIGGRHAKKVLIVFSDAVDDDSRNSFSDIRRRLRLADVILYCVVISRSTDNQSPTAQRDQSLIDELARLTGGRAFFAANRTEVNEIAERIGIELQKLYRITYRPKTEAGVRKPTEWQEVEVKFQPSPELKERFKGKVPKFYVRTRRGYVPVVQKK